MKNRLCQIGLWLRLWIVFFIANNVEGDYPTVGVAIVLDCLGNVAEQSPK